MPVDPAIDGPAGRTPGEARADRDQRVVQIALAALKKADDAEDNVLYGMKDALRARATVGEVWNALREGGGLTCLRTTSDLGHCLKWVIEDQNGTSPVRSWTAFP
ncbi:hypothetical protein SHIRM173S_01366 [Streptomyces hirsutus]